MAGSFVSTNNKRTLLFSLELTWGRWGGEKAPGSAFQTNFSSASFAHCTLLSSYQISCSPFMTSYLVMTASKHCSVPSPIFHHTPTRQPMALMPNCPNWSLPVAGRLDRPSTAAGGASSPDSSSGSSSSSGEGASSRSEGMRSSPWLWRGPSSATAKNKNTLLELGNLTWGRWGGSKVSSVSGAFFQSTVSSASFTHSNVLSLYRSSCLPRRTS